MNFMKWIFIVVSMNAYFINCTNETPLGSVLTFNGNIISTTSDYLNHADFQSLRRTCITYRILCDKYTKTITQHHYLPLLSYATRAHYMFHVKDIIQISSVPAHNDTIDVQFISYHFIQNPTESIVRGVDSKSKLPFIAFSLFNLNNVKQKMDIAVLFNRSDIQRIMYRTRKTHIAHVQDRNQKDIKLNETTHTFGNNANNFDIIIQIITEQKVNDIFSTNEVWSAHRPISAILKTYWKDSPFAHFYRNHPRKAQIFCVLYVIYVGLLLRFKNSMV
eukprot:38805_1